MHGTVLSAYRKPTGTVSRQASDGDRLLTEEEGLVLESDVTVLLTSN